MRGRSHQALGRYLVARFMQNYPKRYARAFLIGCIEPDRNPTTYIKGSFRSQRLRGHNWGNSQRFMNRISHRLEQREKLRIYDFYTLGKLIHYTVDTFTYVHNAEFHGTLKEHREYESYLQNYFLRYVGNAPQSRLYPGETVMATIRSCHDDYILHSPSVHTDSRYAVNVCCIVLSLLLHQPHSTVS